MTVWNKQFTSWVSCPRFPQVQVSPQEVKWRRDPSDDHSLVQYQLRSGWPGCRKHASQSLLPPAESVAHCTALVADSLACFARGASPTSYVPLSCRGTCTQSCTLVIKITKQTTKEKKEVQYGVITFLAGNYFLVQLMATVVQVVGLPVP